MVPSIVQTPLVEADVQLDEDSGIWGRTWGS